MRKDYLASIEDSLERENPKPVWSHIRKKYSLAQLSLFRLNSQAPLLTLSNYLLIYSTLLFLSLSLFPILFYSASGAVCCAFPTIPLLTPLNVECRAGKLDAYVGPRDDGLPNLFLAKTGQSIYLPFSIIFKNALEENNFPNLWEKALIIPIRKTGDHTLAENCHPISFLSSLKRYVSGWLIDHFGHLIVKKQHSFIKHRSTASSRSISPISLSNV